MQLPSLHIPVPGITNSPDCAVNVCVEIDALIVLADGCTIAIAVIDALHTFTRLRHTEFPFSTLDAFAEIHALIVLADLTIRTVSTRADRRPHTQDKRPLKNHTCIADAIDELHRTGLRSN